MAAADADRDSRTALQSGVGVAVGYLKRPGLTAERFIADPFVDETGRRMYATGDLARWRPDGYIDCLGRVDRQVKLGGQRIELGEIEHAVEQHPDVDRCAVILHDDTQLVAYLVGSPDLTDLHQHLADRLPLRSLPVHYLTLAALPLTANNKLDIARLPKPNRATRVHVAPRTPTEHWLADAWQDIVDAERVSATDNFFELGGDSLNATQLVARIASQLNRRLPLRKSSSARRSRSWPFASIRPVRTRATSVVIGDAADRR